MTTGAEREPTRGPRVNRQTVDLSAYPDLVVIRPERRIGLPATRPRVFAVLMQSCS